ncbi:MAG: hypothetical protein OHK0013_42120 [Sandaracinaceae bacterium]
MKTSESLWIGVGVGCSLLVLCGLCVLGAGVVYVLRTGDEIVRVPEPMLGPTPRPTPPPPPPPQSPSTPPPIVGPATPLVPGMPSTGTDLRRVRATVTESNGLADVPVGSACTADVTRHDREDGTFWCNAQITCGTRLVYGGPEAGFFQCMLYQGTRRDVVGTDAATTAEDRDPAMSLNTVGGTLEVWDDASGTLGGGRVRARVEAIE